jgi:2-methylcitrate dehydratase PrpD
VEEVTVSGKHEKTKSEAVAAFIAAFDLDDAPRELAGICNTAFIDTTGAMLSGSRQASARIVCDVAAAEEAKPVASVVGRSLRTSPMNAALANGMAAQALDYDFTFMIGQSAAALIPGILPLAERISATPREMISAFIVGCEVCSRLARSYPAMSSGGGWHGAGVIGAVAAAAAYAKLTKLPTEAIPSVIGLSASMAAGLGTNFGTMTKPLHPGLAARNGMLALFLGERGFTASPTAIEGKNGFLRSFAKGESWTSDAFNDLGTKFDLIDPGYKIKPYACGGLLHTAIDAALNLREDTRGRLDEIAHIVIGVTQHTKDRVIDRYPWSRDSSRFSLEYLVAYSIVHGAPTQMAFVERSIGDENVRSLAAMCEVVVDQKCNALAGTGYSPSQIAIHLKNGKCLQNLVYFQSGTKEVPMSAERIRDKFLSSAIPVIGDRQASTLYDYLEHLSERRDTSELWPLIVPRTGE